MPVTPDRESQPQVHRTSIWRCSSFVTRGWTRCSTPGDAVIMLPPIGAALGAAFSLLLLDARRIVNFLST